MDWMKMLIVTVLATTGALALEAFVTRSLSSSTTDTPSVSTGSGADAEESEDRQRRSS